MNILLIQGSNESTVASPLLVNPQYNTSLMCANPESNVLSFGIENIVSENLLKSFPGEKL
jgi:hypothetical protein